MKKALIILLFMSFGVWQNLRAQQSLYSDIRAHRVGDVITVVLMENISGSSTTNAHTKSNTDGSASASAKTSFIPIQPYFDSSAKLDYTSDENITADQHQLLQGNLSVKIEKVSANGDLIVSGSRLTEIDGEAHKITLHGLIRPSDIDSDNRIPSYKVADAEIIYRKKEGLRHGFHRPGTFRKMLFGVLGITIGAAIVMEAKKK